MDHSTRHRVAVRAVIVHDDRLLLVNAYPGFQLGLWCAPGGGAELHASLPDNLIREVHEETGMTVAVGPPMLVNEFHEPEGGFHQVEVFFRCEILSGGLSDDWRDPAGVVKNRKWFTRKGAHAAAIKPASLPDIAWGDVGALTYDPLEPILS